MKKKILLKERIFPTITTISKNWVEKIKEAGKLGLKEICFFPTCLKEKERKIAYRLLKKISIKRIPIVHLREDMGTEELDYLIKNYQSQAFTIHSQTEFPLSYDLSKYKKMVFVENVFKLFSEKEVDYFGGVSLDLSHLENARILYKEKFEKIKKLLGKYPIGCNHISAVEKVAKKDSEGNKHFDRHYFKNLSEFDYLKKYPKRYFSNLIAIELENSIKEQLLAKEHILKILEGNR